MCGGTAAVEAAFVLFSLFISVIAAVATKGTISFELPHPAGLRATTGAPLRATPVTVWCSPDQGGVALKRATLTRLRDKHKWDWKAGKDKKNATFTLGTHATSDDASDYTCQLETVNHGALVHRFSIFLRPILQVSTASRYDSVDDSGGETVIHFETFGHSVQQGAAVNLTCPVFGFPPPRISWTKGDSPLEQSEQLVDDGRVIHIKEASFEQEGVYACQAINEFTTEGTTHKPMLHLKQQLVVKSEYAWVWPLIVIVVILLLLILIIVFCEIRRKRNEKKLVEFAEE